MASSMLVVYFAWMVQQYATRLLSSFPSSYHDTNLILACCCTDVCPCLFPCVLQLQFNMRGPGGIAIVNADMFKDGSGSWDYMYLIVDVKSGQSPVQRLNIVAPKLVPAA